MSIDKGRHVGEGLDPVAQRDTEIRAAQIDQLYSQGRIGLIGAMVGAAVLIVALWDVVSHSLLFLWLVCYIAVHIPRQLLITAYHKAAPGGQEVFRWGTWFALGNVIGGSLWGLIPVLFFPADSPLYHFIVAIFVAGISCGAATVYWPLTKAYLPTIIVELSPLAGRFIYEGDKGYIIVGLVIVLFALVLLAMARNMIRMNGDSLKSRFEREDSIEALGRARDELERKVTERTAELVQSNKQLVEEIAQRKDAEATLRDSEERLTLAMKGGNLGFWDWHPQEDLFVVNDRVYELGGYSREEIDPKLSTWVALLHPEDRDATTRALFAHMAGQEPFYKSDYRLMTKSGGWIWVHSRGMVLEGDEQGNALRVAGVIIDITGRKKAEERLKQSEEKYRVLVEHAGEAIFVLQDDTTKFVNTMGSEMMRADAAELMSRPFLEFVHPEEREMANEYHVKRLERQAVPSHYEMRLLNRAGSTIWAEIRAVLIEWEGRPATLVLATDISGRKIAEEALRKSEQMMKSIVSASPVGIGLTTRDRRLLWVNDAWLNIFGYENQDECIGKNARMLYPSQAEFERVGPILYDSLRTGKVAEAEARMVRRDGTSFDAQIRMSAVDLADVEKGLIAAIVDVSHRKAAQQELLASEQKYRSLFEESLDGIYIAARDGTLIDANQSYLDLFGYAREEAIGKNVLVMYGDPLERARFIQSVEQTGSVKDYPLRLRTKNGTEMDYLVSATVRRAHDGTILGHRGIMRDVTQQKNLQKQLLQAQKMEALGTLAGGIAHDFNNLLTIVMGFAELLLADKEQDNPEYADLEKIHLAAKDGAELVQRLLMFSRKTEPKPVPMNLNRLIMHLERLLSRTLPKMIDIQVDLLNDLPEINADTSQMEQVLINLAVNARDAMPHGGHLTVKTDVVTLDEAYCALHVGPKPGQYVVVTVSDTGHGMDRETLEHIFEPFFTTKELGRGTGLGLAMVHGIVNQHNGHINCFSEVGRGTTFKVYLPAIPATVETKVALPGMLYARATETVLLVDDEQVVRELGYRILTRFGYTVLQASDGKEALDVFTAERERISLTILDLSMPEGESKECLREILRLEPRAKVVVGSGYVADTSVGESIEMGARGFVRKPFRVNDLLGEVRRVLDES